MNKPNKRQRHEIYKKLLKEISQLPSHTFYGGLCTVLYTKLKLRHGIYVLPELMAQRPKKYGLYWWKPDNWTPRIKAVKKAIELSAPKPRKQAP